MKVFHNRYLSTSEKDAVLRMWRCTRSELPAASRFADADRGLPDVDMVPYCEEINAIDGICTLQSCAGHGHPDDIRSAGHLWLKLDEKRSASFDQKAPELAQTRGIEKVSRVYTAWGEEVVTISFHGNERNVLQVSMHSIVSFLREL